MLSAVLLNVSWRFKIMLLGALPLLLLVLVSAVSGLTLQQQNNKVATVLADFQLRQEVASNSALAIVRYQEAVMGLIVANQSSDIRNGAIASIRASSSVDESVQLLQKSMPNDPQVKQLAQTLAEIRPQQMKLISLAKANKDEEAFASVQALSEQTDKVFNLAKTVLEREQKQLGVIAEQNSAEGRQLSMGLWVVSGVFIVLVGSICWYLSKVLLQGLQEIRDISNDFADGNLQQRACDYPEGSACELAAAELALYKAISQTQQTVAGIRSQAQALQKNSAEIGQSATQTKDRTEQLQQQITVIDSSIESLNNLSDDVASELKKGQDGSSQTASACHQASTEIGIALNKFQGFESELKEAMDKTNELSGSADMIRDITGTIRDISEQTNLLALNAAIEAARAGDQGRGFAVVAEEVRNLAKRSSEAVEQISTLAISMGSNVSEAISQLNHSGETMEENIQLLSDTVKNTEHSSRSSEQAVKQLGDIQQQNSVQKKEIDNICVIADQLTASSEINLNVVQGLNGLANELDATARELNGLVAHFS